MELADFLRYEFIQRAAVAGSFIALSCALLGVFLVLRRLSLIGDGLAHVTFGSVALGLLLKTSPVYVSIPVVMASSIGILKLTERAKIHGDAAIGIVSAVGIAAGVLLASMAGGFNVDLFSYLFGSILAISKAEVIISIILSVSVIFVTTFFYNDLFSLTFDEEFARVSGVRVKRINTILVMLTAITVVLAMRIVGIMLISALLILPAVTAFQLTKGFKTTIVIASLISVMSVILGIFTSIIIDTPTGATIVIVNFIFFMLAFTYKKAIS